MGQFSVEKPVAPGSVLSGNQHSEILPDENRTSCLRFLFNALRYSLGVKVERVMTDNGSSFRSRRCAKALRGLSSVLKVLQNR